MFSKGNKPTETPAPEREKLRTAKGTPMPSIVSAGLHVTGNMTSDGDIQIEGAIDGDVTSRHLTIGEAGAVKGQVSAEEVLVNGTVEGKIKAKTVTLAKSARVTGDIVHDMLSVEAGAFVEGALKRFSKPEAVSSGGASRSEVRHDLKPVHGANQPVVTIGGGKAEASKG